MNFSSPTVVRSRHGVFLAFAMNGFTYASWMSRLPDIKQTLGLSAGQQGTMLLAISVGSIVGLPVAGKIVEKLGASRSIALAATIYVPGLIAATIAVAWGSHVFAVMPGLFLFGLGSGLWDVTQNVEGARVEQAGGRTIMAWFHAAFSAGTVLGALIGAGVIALDIPISAHLFAVAACTIATAFACSHMFAPQDAATPVPARHAEKAATSPWKEPRTLLIGVMALAASFAEGTANDWLAVAFTEGHHVTNSQGVLALATFLIFMTGGRIIGTGLIDRFGRVPVLRFLFGAALIGSVLVVFGTTAVAFTGAAIWGIGASLGFPVGMSAAADDPVRAAARISVVSTIGYGAFLAGPPFLGFLGNHVGVLHALLFVAATSIVAIVVAPAAHPLRQSPPSSQTL